jgi:hypothetical protein
MGKVGCLCIAVCILFSLGGRSPTFGQTLTPDEIIAKFLEKARKDFLYIGDNYIHEELEITDNLKNGVVTERGEKLFIVKKEEESFYKKLVAKDGVPADDSSFELKREIVSISPGFFKRYFFALERSEVFEGRKCRVLSFKPRGNFPEEKREDRILNNLAGEIWIVQNTFDLARITFRLIREVSYAWPGFVGGKARKVEGVITGGLINGYLVVNSVRIEYEYSVRALFWPKNVHLIKTIRYQNYERRNPR